MPRYFFDIKDGHRLVDPAGRELMAKFYRALGDPTRLDLLRFCAEKERTGTECRSSTYRRATGRH